jgi:hypothetical protein
MGSMRVAASSGASCRFYAFRSLSVSTVAEEQLTKPHCRAMMALPPSYDCSPHENISKESPE